MVPIGQRMANLRRKGVLGKDAEQARARAQRLATPPSHPGPLAETETGGFLARRDRLDAEQRAALTERSVEWA